MPSALLSIAVEAGALIASGAVTWAARRVIQTTGEILDRVEENERRSKRNRRMLVGDEHYDGVLDRLDEAETPEGVRDAS